MHTCMVQVLGCRVYELHRLVFSSPHNARSLPTRSDLRGIFVGISSIFYAARELRPPSHLPAEGETVKTPVNVFNLRVVSPPYYMLAHGRINNLPFVGTGWKRYIE